MEKPIDILKLLPKGSLQKGDIVQKVVGAKKILG